MARLRTDGNRQNGDAHANREVGDDVATLVRLRDGHRGDVRDVVQAAVDDQRCAADSDAGPDVEARRCNGATVNIPRLVHSTGPLTYVAPHWGPINGVVAPDDSVDELEQTLGADPENVENAADVPCCARAFSTCGCSRRRSSITYLPSASKAECRRG